MWLGMWRFVGLRVEVKIGGGIGGVEFGVLDVMKGGGGCG